MVILDVTIRSAIFLFPSNSLASHLISLQLEAANSGFSTLGKRR